MFDSFNREINLMRISITDRCNCFCVYCGNDNCTHNNHLSFEQINQIIDSAIACGIHKFKITGGEPFIRDGAVSFIRQLKSRSQVEEVSVTTNGTLLSFDDIDQLTDIDGITFSLDSMNEEKYYKITKNRQVKKVLENIRYCQKKGIKTKVNVVLSEYTDLQDIEQMKQLLSEGVIVRFIELMKMNRQKVDSGLSRQAVLDIFDDYQQVNIHLGNGPATYYQVKGYSGYIGFIEPVCNKFCHQCNRIRLTSDGHFKPCLFYEYEYKIDFTKDLTKQIEQAIKNKPIGHHLEDDVLKVSMAKVGG